MSVRFPTSLLPQTLLDYTLLRLRLLSQAHALPLRVATTNAAKARQSHSAATSVMNHPPLSHVHQLPTGRDSFISEESTYAYLFQQQQGLTPVDHHSIPFQLHPQVPDVASAELLAELQKRIEALKAAASVEETVLDPPTFTEEELLAIYEDLLDISAFTQQEELPIQDQQANDNVLAEEDIRLIGSVDQRLLEALVVPSNAESVVEPHPASSDIGTQYTVQPYQRVINNAHSILDRMEVVRASFTPGQGGGTLEFPPVGILTVEECRTLVRVALRALDGQAAESALSIMKRSNMEIPSDLSTQVMELYAGSGQIQAVEHLLQNYLTELPNDRQRHLHIKAYLKATPPGDLPTKALELLHTYENQALPAPIQTYTTLITTLFSTQSSVARAHAWDLFTHMRYVAHTKLDVALYTLMIRACASPISTRRSEPERALDLWHEMTVDQRMVPTVGAYDAIILACARSGIQAYVNEGFRLAKEMLDSHRDASGWSAYRPDRRTFCALLEGAKRIGDLSRARWILAEMVRSKNEAGDALETDTEIDEEVMMHVFHAYAAYLPPFERRVTQVIDSNQNQRPGAGKIPESISNDAPGTSVQQAQDEFQSMPTFGALPPQSKPEVIAEVQALFHRILEDTGINVGDPAQDEIFAGQRIFRSVQLSTRLLNSYISVFYKHSLLETSRTLFWDLFDELKVDRSVRSYVEALERCAHAKKGFERTTALQFSNELWSSWQKLENDNKLDAHARLIERAHIARIRTLALVGDLNGALTHVRAFFALYPPSAIRQFDPKLSISSTRTVLTGNKPLVRMTGTSEIPDDRVPPLLTFGDLEILHHRLVAAGDRENAIGYLKYVSKAYEWALRVRRDEAMKAKPGQ
ncbi:hypothetical protein AX16_001962 [Volvariella volvacea WC 439]|nr:hypothetical protein AX16_001962 [Volvariella volvacea WC 439]